MGLLTGSWLVDVVIIVATSLLLVYQSMVRFYKQRDIPYLRPCPVLGTIQMFAAPSQHDWSQQLYQMFPGERFFGAFQGMSHTIVIKDPDLVHRIMVKDFTHFYDRGFPSFEGEGISSSLFFLKGQSWRNLRYKMIPIFTSGRIKHMFSHFIEAAKHTLEDIENSSREAIDVQDMTGNYATEVVGSVVFGVNFSRSNPQREEVVSMINLLTKMGPKQQFFGMLSVFLPSLSKFFKFRFFNEEASDYFRNLIKANKEYRVKNKVERNDFFQQLLDLQQQEASGKITLVAPDNEEDDLISQLSEAPHGSQVMSDVKMMTEDAIMGQAFGFVMGGTDSFTSVLNLALYHIAKDSKIGDKVREEVESAVSKHGGWTYQAIKEMQFMDQVLQETLRLYPTITINFRQVTVPYPIPGTDIVLEKGSVVTIPVSGLHMDPNFYPSPETFDPERFKGNNHKPGPTYLPFGDGPRMCIAMRFAIVELKVCLAMICSQYTVQVNSKTQEPFVWDRTAFNPKPQGGIHLNFIKHSSSIHGNANEN